MEELLNFIPILWYIRCKHSTGFDSRTTVESAFQWH